MAQINVFPLNNVFNIELATRLERSNTLRSSSYELKASRLGNFQQRRLRIIEEKLFGKRCGLDGCKAGQMQKLEGRFHCAEGQIWYYFSKPKQKFILLDFAFGEGGSGGLPVPPDDCEPNSKQPTRCGGMFGPAQWAARLAIALVAVVWKRPAILAEHVLTNVKKPVSKGAPFLKKELELARFCFAGKVPLPAGDLFWISRRLPASSILSDFVVVKEQLQNNYARSILVGEALCRVATHSALGRNLLLQAKLRPIVALDLLQESSSVLNIMCAGDGSGRVNLKHFFVTKTLNENPLADDFLMAIVRGELTTHLSVYVAHAAASALPSSQREPASSRHTKIQKVMKKFALLADFASLSENLFRSGRTGVEAELLRYNCLSRPEIIIAEITLRDIGRLDLSIRHLLADIGGTNDHNGINDGDLPTLHHKLLKVTKEMLGPLE